GSKSRREVVATGLYNRPLHGFVAAPTKSVRDDYPITCCRSPTIVARATRGIISTVLLFSGGRATYFWASSHPPPFFGRCPARAAPRWCRRGPPPKRRNGLPCCPPSPGC
ncbi:unnamed protein product, partial [Ectocarpus sp. 4 AP-2014]